MFWTDVLFSTVLVLAFDCSFIGRGVIGLAKNSSILAESVAIKSTVNMKTKQVTKKNMRPVNAL